MVDYAPATVNEIRVVHAWFIHADVKHTWI